MAISRIRGEQIKQQVIKDQHIASDAAIQESKLAIDWAAHYQQALVTKKVVDYVQVNGTDVGGFGQIDISAVIPNTVPHVNSDPLSGEGVIVDAPKNKAIIRDAVTGDPVLDENQREVYGRVEFDDAGNNFVLKFFTFDPTANGGAGAEVPFTMPAGQKIDWQYAKRFNLDTVDEMFAANEKFVEGAADATAHLNIDQLAKDLYGASFSLDRDGNPNLTVSVVDQIANEVAARQAGDQAIRDDLASNLAGKGANLIGVEDAAGKFIASTVEGVLAELQQNIENEALARSNADTAIRNDLSSTAVGNGGAKRIGVSSDAGLTGSTVEDVLKDLNTRLTNQESGGGAEVTETHDREAASANGYFAQKTGAQAFASLEERLLDIETVVDEKAKVADDTAAEVQTARGTFENLDARLDDVDARIAAEQDARQQGDQAIRDDLASNAAGKGASLIGIEDPNGKVTATNVEGAILELADRATAVEGRASDLETEVHAARGSAASLDARLDRALNEDGTLKAGRDIHKHYKAYYQATGGESVINLSAFNVPDLPPYQVGDNTLDVYVNGILQNEGLHYSEVAGGQAIDFSMGDGTTLVAGDIVTIKYQVNNLE
jgi:hypothetical protein